MIRPGFPRVTLNFPNPETGTGPFSFGFNVGESDDSGDLALLTEAVRIWWNGNATVAGYFSSDLGAGNVTAVGEYGGVLVEDVDNGALAPTGSPSDLPGVSVRALMQGNRPVGGRRGSFFVPLLEAAGADEHGVINGTYHTNISSWLNDLVDAVETAVVGVTIRTLHTIDSVESQSVVTGITAAETVSFLQRRYR
jgi:hypothetical protein